MSASFTNELTRSWIDRLAHFRRHRNPEHLEALHDEARRFAGFALENDLSSSAYWSKTSLDRRVAVLLFLVDRGVVERKLGQGRPVYEPSPTAEEWVVSQPALAPYVGPTLELIAALRRAAVRRGRASRNA